MAVSLKQWLKTKLQHLDDEVAFGSAELMAAVQLLINPSPYTSERRAMLHEQLAQAERAKIDGRGNAPIVEGIGVTDNDIKLYSSFLRGAILLHLVTSSPSWHLHNSGTIRLGDYFVIWRDCADAVQIEERAIRKLPPSPEADPMPLKAGTLWLFASKVVEMRHPTLTDLEFIFPDESFDAEFVLSSLEEYTGEREGLQTVRGIVTLRVVVGQVLGMAFDQLVYRSCRLLNRYLGNKLAYGVNRSLRVFIDGLKDCLGGSDEAVENVCEWRSNECDCLRPVMIEVTDRRRRGALLDVISSAEGHMYMTAALETRLPLLRVRSGGGCCQRGCCFDSTFYSGLDDTASGFVTGEQ